jgi:hypothetical protein
LQTKSADRLRKDVRLGVGKQWQTALSIRVVRIDTVAAIRRNANRKVS